MILVDILALWRFNNKHLPSTEVQSVVLVCTDYRRDNLARYKAKYGCTLPVGKLREGEGSLFQLTGRLHRKAEREDSTSVLHTRAHAWFSY